MSAARSIKELAQKAQAIRQSIITSLVEAGSGHTAGPLGMADVFAALYFQVMNHDPDKPDWDGRDRLILSNGHICPVLYAAMAEAGYFPKKELGTLRQINSRLQGHPHYWSVPGVENTSGPLGQGLSQACGLAYGLRLSNNRARVYAIMGDGEQQEGQNWEAYWFAGVNRLSNLTALIDRNNIQIDGYTEDVLPLQPFRHKLEAFRWNVLDIDGHNLGAIVDACYQAQATQQQPTAIICNTIPGQGVEFMENLPVWHGQPPDKDQAREALRQLRTLGGRLDCRELS